jgi:predicted  nucleic acid-binding Zn-ribbon protein
MVIKCSKCGEPLKQGVKKCPRCGSTKRTHFVEVSETMTSSGSSRFRQRSGKKDQRGKPIREADIKVKGNVERRITKDRSKRLEGIPETDVTHEVIKNGKTIHGPHLEPKDKKSHSRIKKN